MSTTTFKCPRQTDREVISILQQLAEDAKVSAPGLYFVAFQGGGGHSINFDAVEANPILVEILGLAQASLQSIVLSGYPHPNGPRHLISVNRNSKELFDEVQVHWQAHEPIMSEPQFARLLGLAKHQLREVKIEGTLAGFANEEINKYYEARDATLTRLETINRELLFGIHERQKQLDAQFDEKVEKLRTEVKGEREALKVEFDGKAAELEGKSEALKKREAEFDTRESKYLRRELRKDMLTRLATLSEKFELTQGTRKLRLPITAFTLVFMAFFATMTVLSFVQTTDIIKVAGQDLTKLNWWQLGFLVLKQLGFAAAFLGGAWFYIKWNDRWFRQHADAEFMFKQLELDINRASWVVEMALEWKDEKGRELPPELLDRLTRNFSDKQHSTPMKLKHRQNLHPFCSGLPPISKLKHRAERRSNSTGKG
jgi:hypothetical protein